MVVRGDTLIVVRGDTLIVDSGAWRHAPRRGKMDYIHNNPVVAGLVDRPQDYLYSSARDYCGLKKVGLLEVEWL